MKKVSIVIPVYNVKDYLSKCLDSIVNQDFDLYDAYVINDGSPFGEEEIIKDYQNKYPNIINYISKENGGYGSCLELAFSKTDSEYVLVCDSDDYLSNDCLKTLYEKASTNNLDIVVGAKNLIYSDNNEIQYDKSFNELFSIIDENKIYQSNEKDFDDLYFINPSPHSKLYRTSIVKNLAFPHKVSYTDNLLFFYSLSNAKRVGYISKSTSFYLINRVGNTMTDLKPKIIDDMVLVFKDILNKANGSPIFYYRMFDSFYEIFLTVNRIKGDETIKREKYAVAYSFLEEIIKHNKDVLEKMEHYSKDSAVVYNQKRKLLNNSTSKKMYECLINNTLNPSLINKIKSRLV